MRQALIVFLILATPVLAAEPISGRASVTDGDTVVIHSTRIRLPAPAGADTASRVQGQTR